MSEPTKRRTGLQDLSPEQRAVVESWGQGLAVMAGAGSGKTTTLVIKCEELLRRKPDARFVAVSFTERSAGDLRAKLSERLSLKNGHWVATIHGLCSSILREYPREAGFDGEETMLSEPEALLLWEQLLESLWLDALPEEVERALSLLLERESRDSVAKLLRRVREIAPFGALERLAGLEDPHAAALAEVGRFVLDRYDRAKRRRGALDFSDLEQGADRALEHEHVRQAYHRRFDLVLVDEFQDTNPLQARILWRFARPDASNLCVVGDPKQSIYRFRDADVSVFEELCARLPVNRSLTWNFRSRPGIIEFANQVCSPAFTATGMRFDSLVPRREALPELEPVVRLDVERPEQLAHWIHAQCAKGVALEDMALLLRKIRGNEKWLKALTAAGVPIAVGSGGLFWEDPRVRELVALLKWWDNPGNALSGAIFMRAPWVGVDDRRIDAWLKEDPLLREPFFSSGHPLAHALAPLRERWVRPGQVLLALLVSSQVEEEIGAPLLGLWHRVEELSSAGLDFHAVVSELGKALEEGRRERDVPPPRNLGQLSVLTLHGSKGLEFPHVILVDFGEKSRAPDTPLLFWDRYEGAFLAGRDADGDRVTRQDPIESRWKERELEHVLSESMRVFYVALTRARERLVLVFPPVKPPKEPKESKTPKKGKKAKADSEPEAGESPWKEAFTRDHWRGWVEAVGSEQLRAIQAGEESLSPIETPEGTREMGVRAKPVFAGTVREKRARHSVTEWNLLSRCPLAYEWTYLRADEQLARRTLSRRLLVSGVAASRGDSPDGEGDALPQRELGTRVHACLETGDFDGLRALEKEAGEERFSSEAVIAWMKSTPEMAPADEGPEGRHEVWSELGFELQVGEEVLVGSMDRLVCDRVNGELRYRIIDFKVTRELKTASELLDAYETQLQLYALALFRLEPSATPANTSVAIVCIGPSEVRTVEVPLKNFDAESLARTAGELVAGQRGKPAKGEYCKLCSFKPACPAWS